MCTLNITYDKKNKKANDIVATMIASGLFFVEEVPEKKDRVYIEDGEVKWDIVSEAMSIDKAKDFTHQVIDLEYSLP